MSFFENKSSSPTKMFISIPSDAPQTRTITKSNITDVISKMIPGGFPMDILLNAAPKLIEEGLELLSSTINKFAKENVTKTIVKRNIDVLNDTQISIPSNITIIRGDFAPSVNNEGSPFGDAGKHQASLIGHRELHIEIDVKKSKDGKSIYFQPTKYFYNGVDREKDVIDEIVLAFAFVPVNKTIMNVETLSFQSFLHFDNLTPHTQYDFEAEENSYDSNYQSPWMQPQLDPTVPYTLVIEIQEIREGNSFAKLLQTVYTENKSYITEELQAKVKLLEALNKTKETKPQDNETTVKKPTVTKS